MVHIGTEKSSTGGRPQGPPPLICSTPTPTRAFTFSCIGYPHRRDTCPPVNNHPTSLGKRERQGDYLPPGQGRSPVTCPPDRVPPFPLRPGFYLAWVAPA